MKSVLSLLSIFASLMFLALPVGAVTLSLNPSNSTIIESETINIELSIAGLNAGASPSLGAFGIEVLFDETVLSFTSVVFDAFLGVPDSDFTASGSDSFETDIFVDISSPGKVLLDEFSFLFDFELDTLQSDSFRLATLTFTGVAVGTSALGFGLVDLSDAIGSTISNPTLQTASVNVAANPIPEPSTMLLVGTGLAGLAALRWKRA